MRNIVLPLLAVLGLAGANLPAFAGIGTTLAEKRLTDELSVGLTEGSALPLGDADQTFLGIYAPARSGQSKGGVILLHDWNAHADWPEVISPLRRALVNSGWHTLSIQLPVPPPGELSAKKSEDLETEIQRRIQAAADYCRSQHIFNLVLVGHQFGAIMAGRYLAKNSAAGSISAFVALNLYSPVEQLRSFSVTEGDWATQVKSAFLDLVPGRSPDHVLQLAADRKAAMRKLSHDKYRQIHIIGSDYTFGGSEHEVLSRIQVWLTRLAPSIEVPVTSTTGTDKPR